MVFLDLAIAQPSFVNYMRTPRVHISSVKNGLLSNNFTHGPGNKLALFQKLVLHTEIASFSTVPVRLNRAKFVIKAVATLQPKRTFRNEGAKKDYENLPSIPESLTPKLNVESSSEDLVEVQEREKLRRERISKANKGNTPWNKGRKHSPETLQRIKERTRLAMQDPKVKKKLEKLGHAQSDETRKKIGLGVQMGWRKRREKLLVQETCFFNWQNLVAEAARQGFVDDEELQWDTYVKLNQQLQQEWLESVEQRKVLVKPKGNKRAPKSLEQRRKIAASIAAKWADPEYRNRVFSGLSKYHGSPIGVKKIIKSTGEGRSRKRSPKKEINDGDKLGKTSIRQPKSKKRKGPMYKDPLAKVKFEMIKNIRARRTPTDMKKHEALDRAKSMIKEAEKAAKALEIAAASSPIAEASLIETRRLIDEAVQLIQSIDKEDSTPVESGHMLIQFEHGDETKEQEGMKEGDQIEHQVPLNGTHFVKMEKGDVEDFDFVQHSFVDSANHVEQKDDEKPDVIDTYEMPAFVMYDAEDKPIVREAMDPPENNKLMIKVNGTPVSELNINGGSIKINGAAQQNGVLFQATNPTVETCSTAVKKRWVRGRLVNVVEEE